MGDAYGFNEFKLLILEALEGGESAAGDLASLGSREAVSMALMRYHRMGLLHRRREGHGYVYSLSQRGIERLEYLRDVDEVSDIEDE